MNHATPHPLLGMLLLCALAACSGKKEAPAQAPTAQAVVAPATPAVTGAQPEPAAPAASAPPPAIVKKATLDCDDRTIVLEATCSKLYGAGPLACSAQSLAVGARGGATPAVHTFAPQPPSDGDPALVEEKIGTLSCVKSDKGERYLVASMYNGGNCPECEWHEAYDWNGKLVASDRDRAKPSALLDGLLVTEQRGGDGVIGKKELDGFYTAPSQ